MGSANQLDTTLSNRTRSHRFKLPTDLIDHNHLGVMIFNCFNHHLVLERRLGYLHSPGSANRRMRHITISANFVAGIHNDHPRRISQDARRFSQDCSFTNARSPQDQNAGTRFDQILNNITGAINCTPNAEGQTDHITMAISDR